MLSVNITDFAYAAGIVDGEGSICIEKRPRTDGQNYYRGLISVTNTNLGLLNWFQASFGGHINDASRKNRLELGHKQVWHWNITTPQSIQDFLTLILPYLKVKKMQADLMLAYTKHRLDTMEWLNQNFMETCYKEMGNLNGRPKH